MGVVWGEGEGPTIQHGRAIGADMSDWFGRLVRTIWRRLFIYGGEA